MEAKGLTEDQALIKDAFENIGIRDYVMVEKNGVKIAVMGIIGIDSVACIAVAKSGKGRDKKIRKI